MLSARNGCRDIGICGGPSEQAEADSLWEGTEVSDGEDSSELEEEESSPREEEVAEVTQQECSWCIAADESVYNDAVLRVVTARQLMKEGEFFFGLKWLTSFRVSIFASTLLLVFNASLQLTVLSRVKVMVDIAVEDKQAGVFSSCLKRSPADLPFSKNLAPQDWYWDCAPLMTTLLTNVSFLDVNGDGIWSPADDPHNLSSSLRLRYNKNGNLSVVLRSFIRRAKEGKFLAQKGLLPAEVYKQTLDWTAVPMKWLEKDQPLIDMCMNTDAEMCGNLENRGVLKLKLAILDEDLTPSARVLKCREIVEDCKQIYGEFYRYHAYSQAQQCGGYEYSWDAKELLTITRYDIAARYDRVGNKRAITARVYEVFLALVLIIWWLVVVDEARQVISWWVVVIFKPATRAESKHADALEDSEEDAESIRIHVIPKPAKLYIMFFILLPRTLIAMGLSWQGSLFLIMADSYADLILNSTALAFLTEIDNSLFAALCSEKTKDKMKKLEPIAGVAPLGPRLAKIINLPTSVPLIVMVTAIVSGFIFTSFCLPRGKIEMAEAFSCLCHAEGVRCVAAQIFGGAFHVPAAEYE